jgi:hypothetical protein
MVPIRPLKKNSGRLLEESLLRSSLLLKEETMLELIKM